MRIIPGSRAVLWIPAALSLLVGLVATLAFALPDTSPPRLGPREWKDGHGRVIKRLENGRLTLFGWDVEGRLVRIAGLQGGFTSRSAESPLTAPDEWVHCFEYGRDAALSREADCVGRWHEFEASRDRKVDLRRGTALEGHQHIRWQAGETGVKR